MNKSPCWIDHALKIEIRSRRRVGYSRTYGTLTILTLKYFSWPQESFPLIDFLFLIFIPIFSHFQPSSCLGDRDGDQIYDYASKYRAQMRQQQAKMLMTPQGYVCYHYTVFELLSQGVTKLFRRIKMIETLVFSYIYQKNYCTLYVIRVLSLLFIVNPFLYQKWEI